MRILPGSKDFYSHAPYGTWPTIQVRLCTDRTFLLTRPLRDVTRQKSRKSPELWGISTHTPLTGRDTIWIPDPPDSLISTHTPLTGRDEAMDTGDKAINISTHTPLTGRDWFTDTMLSRLEDFYSHAPYGTWPELAEAEEELRNFYSHAPYGTWQMLVYRARYGENFYSHAPYGTWLLSK